MASIPSSTLIPLAGIALVAFLMLDRAPDARPPEVRPAAQPAAAPGGRDARPVAQERDWLAEEQPPTF